MKKIITNLAFVALSSVSAKALDFSVFSLTGGVTAGNSVWGATAQQDEYDSNNSGTIDTSNKESGVFTSSYGSYFYELGIGKYVSFGYDVVDGAISTPENVNSGGHPAGGDTSKVSVDFNDLSTTYAKLNIPFVTGLYIKAGNVSTDVDIKETQKSGNSYKNVSVDGTSIGGGYERMLGDTNFSLRAETNYVEFDNITVNNGVGTKTSGGSTANGGFNEIKTSKTEGLTGSIALTYTFGKNRIN